MRTLFEIATTEGWVDTMYAGVDSTEPMVEPIRDNAKVYAWFFVAFILVGSFFVLNLCVGVIIDNIHGIRDDMTLIIRGCSSEGIPHLHKGTGVPKPQP